MRKLKYFVATSVDGFIAHQDGGFDGFLESGKPVEDFFESHRSFDIVLMGRKTYEVGLKAGITSPYPTMRQYVFSRTMQRSPDQQVQLVSENVVGLVRQLKTETGQAIWLCGGAELAATLFAENLIDEITLKVNPLLLGSGIPFFSRAVRQTALELISSKTYHNGCVWLDYQVSAR
jgi:dihydrofolate reductase